MSPFSLLRRHLNLILGNAVAPGDDGADGDEAEAFFGEDGEPLSERFDGGVPGVADGDSIASFVGNFFQLAELFFDDLQLWIVVQKDVPDSVGDLIEASEFGADSILRGPAVQE